MPFSIKNVHQYHKIDRPLVHRESNNNFRVRTYEFCSESAVKSPNGLPKTPGVCLKFYDCNLHDNEWNMLSCPNHYVLKFIYCCGQFVIGVRVESVLDFLDKICNYMLNNTQ